ncbi:hypothetical protein [Streptomyces hokutonensis]|uniref:hypothetical protein n=1 Tax=Streptomyces hokutonensis TaxID=1306990 RepID=UPI0036928EB9
MKRGSWATAGRRAVLTDLLVAWGLATALVRLVARLDDDHPGWTDSAVLGALFVVGGHFRDRLKERRRTRARAAADRDVG